MNNSTPFRIARFLICAALFFPGFLAAQQATFDDFLGINIRRGNPLDKIENFGIAREYHEWKLDEGFPGLNGVFETASPGYPNNQFKWNPSYQSQSVGINFDDYYNDIDASGVVLAPVLMQSAPYIINPDLKPSFPTASAQLEQKPLFPGEDALDPASYIEHADWVYQYVARYGQTTFSQARQTQLIASKMHPDETAQTGLGYIEYLEDWNEPNKWWRELTYPSANIEAEEYAAMLSADYDGHNQTMGLVADPDNPTEMISTVGAKNADPTIKMVMSGISDLDTIYIQDVIAWCENNRPANAEHGQYPFDVISFHHYSNVNQGLNTFGQYGISPEEDDLKAKCAAITAWRDQTFPNVELWMSEFGWDTDKFSEQRAPSDGIGQYDQQEVQAQWLVRSYLEIFAAGWDRAMAYDLVDGCTGDTCGLYQSPGLLMSESRDFQPKKSYYQVNTMGNVLGSKTFDADLSPCQDTICAVDCPRVYRFVDPNDVSKKVFAIWSPTACGKAAFNYSLDLEGASEGTLVEMATNSTTGVSSTLTGASVNVSVSEQPIFVVVGENYDAQPAPCINNLAVAENTCSSIRLTWDNTPDLENVQLWYLEGTVDLDATDFDISEAFFVADNVPSGKKEFNISGLIPDSNYTLVVIGENANGSASAPCWLNASTTAMTCKVEIDPSWIFASSNPGNVPTQLFDEQNLDPICGASPTPTSNFGIDLTNQNEVSVSVDLQVLHYIDAFYVYDDLDIGFFKIEYALSPNGPWIQLANYQTVPFDVWTPLTNLISSTTPVRFLRFTSDAEDKGVIGEVILCGRDSGLGAGAVPPGEVQNLAASRISCNSVELTWQPPLDNDLDYFEVTTPFGGMTQIPFSGQQELSFDFENLDAGFGYNFIVTAFDTEGLSTSDTLSANTLPVEDCIDDCGNSCDCFICLKPSWITDLTPVAGMTPTNLVDEQDGIEVFCGSTSGTPLTNWGENYSVGGVPPAKAMLDLQQCHIINEIALFDVQGQGIFEVEYKDPVGNWILLESFTTNQYNVWKRLGNLDIQARYLRFTQTVNQAKISEISVCGFPLNCNSCEEITATNDADSDGVPDACDLCPGSDDFADFDNDGVPDGCDTSCPTEGDICDDGDACTTGDVIDSDCNCAGTFADDDGDGVCNNDDVCEGFDDNLDVDMNGIPDDCEGCQTIGDVCDDGDACTENDVYDSACNCAGTFADADNDGVCDNDDICPGFDDNLDANNNNVPDGCEGGDCSYLTVDLAVENITCFGENDGSISATATCPNTGGGDAINLAENQPVTQSSISAGGEAARAVDGNTDGNFWSTFSVASTGWEQSPWWQVDLGAVEQIDMLEIWNRTDCCQGSLSNYSIFIKDTPFTSDNYFTSLNDPSVTVFTQTGQASFPTELTIDASGRYVRVQLAGADLLYLAEVKVLQNQGGGSCNLTYDWDSNLPSGENQTALAPGIYNLTVTNTADACELTASAEITEPTALNCSASVMDSISIPGGSNGRITANGGDGTTPYTYVWSNGATTQTVMNLSAGTYDVTVLDDNGCMCTTSVELPDPTGGCPETGDACDDGDDCTTGDIIDINCNCVGTFADADSDGVCDNDDICPGFDDNLDLNMNNIPDGCDTTGCGGFVISTQKTDLSCGGTDDGAINLTLPCTPNNGSGGNGSNLALSGTATQSSTNFNADADRANDGNTDGNYWQAFSISGTNWEQSPWWEIDLGAVYDLADIEVWNRTDCCFANLSDFYVFVSDAPFSGSLSSILNDANVTNFFNAAAAETPTTIGANTSGRYVRVQRQGAGFIEIAEVKIFAEAGNTGGGDCNLDIAWSNGSTMEDLTDLAAGTYSVTVTNTDNNCMATASETLTAAVAVNCSVAVLNEISTPGGSDGSLELTASGGNGNLAILWSNGATKSSLSGLSAGNYGVTVTDQSGCSCTSSASLSDPGGNTQDYCPSQGSSPWVEWIERVEFAGIDNESFKELYSYFESENAFVEQGGSYQITLTPGFSWLAFDEFWGVWIDFNKNGSFDDPGEKVVNLNSMTTAALTETINIPAGASLGQTRMRVAMKRGSAPTSCEDFTNGEVEDYNVTITAAGNNRTANETLHFQAKREEFDVNVNWTSNTDFKTNHFILEHSYDGLNFEKIGNFAPLSSGLSPKFYEDFHTPNRAGIQFYRLIQVFENGQLKFSPIREVDMNVDLDAFTVYPNPTGRFLNVHLNSFENRQGSVRLVSPFGQVLEERVFERLSSGAVTFDLAEMPSGLYFVDVAAEGRRRVVRTVILTQN